MIRQGLRKKPVRAVLFLMVVLFMLATPCAALLRWDKCRTLSFSSGHPPPSPYREYWSPPHWTPDGTHIVFATTEDQRHPTQLYSVTATGSALSQLTNGHLGKWVAISPDGSHIAHSYCELPPRGYDRRMPEPWKSVSNAGVKGDIDISALDGSHQRRLVGGEELYSALAWSSDGEEIAFVKTGKNTCPFLFFRHRPAGLYTMKSDGSDVRKIVHINGWNATLGMDGYYGTRLTYISPGSPAWSPDGSRIAAVTFDPDGSRATLYTIAPDGADRHVLVQRNEDGCLVTADAQ